MSDTVWWHSEEEEVMRAYLKVVQELSECHLLPVGL